MLRQPLGQYQGSKKLRLKRSVLYVKDVQELKFLREQPWAIVLIGVRCFDKGPVFVILSKVLIQSSLRLFSSLAILARFKALQYEDRGYIILKERIRTRSISLDRQAGRALCQTTQQQQTTRSPKTTAIVQDGTYESDVDSNKISSNGGPSTQNTDNVQTLECSGYNHTDVVIPFQIVLDNQTQNIV